jgi:hypothetical protein
LARLTGGSLEAVFPIRHRANEDIAQHDSAARALGRLARTFPAQIETLNRYRSHGEPAITVQYVSVGDGGKAIVGNVTQHASVIVSDKKPAPAARRTGTTPRACGGTAPRRYGTRPHSVDRCRTRSGGGRLR